MSFAADLLSAAPLLKNLPAASHAVIHTHFGLVCFVSEALLFSPFSKLICCSAPSKSQET